MHLKIKLILITLLLISLDAASQSAYPPALKSRLQELCGLKNTDDPSTPFNDQATDIEYSACYKGLQTKCAMLPKDELCMSIFNTPLSTGVVPVTVDACMIAGGVLINGMCRVIGMPGGEVDQACLDSKPKDPNGRPLLEHPWECGNPNARFDWTADSARILGEINDSTFNDCFQPQIVKPYCEYCPPVAGYLDWESPFTCKDPFVNMGFVAEYWWPELEVEVNQFGIYAYPPRMEVGPVFSRENLLNTLKANFYPTQYADYVSKLGVPKENITRDPLTLGLNHPALLDPILNIGAHSLLAGETSPDQRYSGDAHGYSTMLQAFAGASKGRGAGMGDLIYYEITTFFGQYCIGIPYYFNGFKKGNTERCFYDTLDNVGTTLKGMTEMPVYAPFWQIQEYSKIINEDKYKASVPFDTTVIAPGSQVNILDLMKNQNSFNLILGALQSSSCTSYRMGTYPKRYGESPLLKAAGFKPINDRLGGDMAPFQKGLRDICYYGGGQLYPLVGTLLGPHSDYLGSGILSRRAMELFGEFSFGGEQYKLRRLKPPLRTSLGDEITSFIDFYFQDFDKRGKLPENHCFVDSQVNRYTTLIGAGPKDDQIGAPDKRELDKLQRIWPSRSKCFKMDELDEADNTLISMQVDTSAAKGSSQRFVYWNKRKACFCSHRGAINSREAERPIDPFSGMNKGWGCQTYPWDDMDQGRGNDEKDIVESGAGLLGEVSKKDLELYLEACVLTPLRLTLTPTVFGPILPAFSNQGCELLKKLKIGYAGRSTFGDMMSFADEEPWMTYDQYGKNEKCCRIDAKSNLNMCIQNTKPYKYE